MLSILNYIQNPQIVEFKKPKMANLGFLYLIYYLICFVSLPLIALIANALEIKHVETSNLSSTFILIGVLLVPVYEEIIFRLCLIFNKRNYFITISVILAIVVYLFFKHKDISAIIFGLVLALFLILYFFDFEKIKCFINKHFKYFFWFSVICFGLIHISNFNGDYLTLFVLFPLICFPQLIMGVILGFIRMQYGFFYSVFIHLMVNAVLLFKLV